MLRRFWWLLFPPIEVRWTRQAIREACKGVGVPELMDRALADARDVETVVYSIRIDRHTPATLAALLISNQAGRMLSSGRHHIYRGVLSQKGRALRAAWDKANEFLVAEGRWTDEEFTADRKALSESIRTVG